MADFKRYTYNGISVQATSRRAASASGKKYERTVRYQGKERTVSYGDPDMNMRRTDDERRRAFLSRHNCDSKRDPFAPGFWACLDWQRPSEGKDMCRDCGDMSHVKTIYAAPKPLSWLDKLRTKQRPGIEIYKGADGLRTMVIVTTNAYKDRDDDIITTDALKEWVERQWIADDQYTPSPLLFWHLDDEPIGEVVYSEVSGRFLIELAKEATTPFAATVWDYIETTPDEDWGASHGFAHYERTPRGEGRVFRAIDKFETSVLPVRYAANPYTFSEVTNGDRT
jgi:hypothetical protein